MHRATITLTHITVINGQKSRLKVKLARSVNAETENAYNIRSSKLTESPRTLSDVASLRFPHKSALLHIGFGRL